MSSRYRNRRTSSTARTGFNRDPRGASNSQPQNSHPSEAQDELTSKTNSQSPQWHSLNTHIRRRGAKTSSSAANQHKKTNDVPRCKTNGIRNLPAPKEPLSIPGHATPTHTPRREGEPPNLWYDQQNQPLWTGGGRRVITRVRVGNLNPIESKLARAREWMGEGAGLRLHMDRAEGEKGRNEEAEYKIWDAGLVATPNSFFACFSQQHMNPAGICLPGQKHIRPWAKHHHHHGLDKQKPLSCREIL